MEEGSALSATAAGSESASTRSRLLDAAERLIGARGIELVSLRSINAAAGGNVAAAHYHFGSKEALVTAVLERRMQLLARQRLELLTPLEQLRRPPVRAVVEALAVPLAGLAQTDGGADYVRFLAALDRAAAPWRALVIAAFAPQWRRLEPVMARALPALTSEILRFRLSVAGTTLLSLLGEPERYPATVASATRLPAVIDVVSGVLCGPPSGRKPQP